MNYFRRILRALRIGLASTSAMPPIQLPLEKRPYTEPPLPPQAFRRARPPIKPPAPADWTVPDPKQWFIYRAFDQYEYVDQGYRTPGHENYAKPLYAGLGLTDYSSKSAYALVRSRATHRVRTCSPEILRITLPLPFNLYWWWQNQLHPKGTYLTWRGKEVPLYKGDIAGDIFWIGRYPVFACMMLNGEAHTNIPPDLHGHGMQWDYITQLKLPQPPLALQQTLLITPALTSELKLGALK